MQLANNKDVVRLAASAGYGTPKNLPAATAKKLARLIALVRAEQREACAKACDALYAGAGPACEDHPTANDAAVAIRALVLN